MRRQAILLSLWLMVATGSLASEDDQMAKSNLDSVPTAITEYFSGLDTIYRQGSTAQDIDDFFNQFDGNVRYVHVNYEADFDRATWHGAFVRNHEAGRYTKSADHCSLVTNSIAGKNHYAIEYAYGTSGTDGCEPEDAKRFLILFGFSDGKINRVQELW